MTILAVWEEADEVFAWNSGYPYIPTSGSGPIPKFEQAI